MFFSTVDQNKASEIDRNTLLTLSDRDLLEQCQVEAFVGSGPGGQHRNRNYTAVRVILKVLPEIVAEDSTSRSQKQNLEKALQKLRVKIARNLRCKAPDCGEYLHLNSSNPLYPLELAKLLDMLSACMLDHKTAALRLNISGSKLLKELARDPDIWQDFQQQRTETGLPPLKIPR